MNMNNFVININSINYKWIWTVFFATLFSFCNTYVGVTIFIIYCLFLLAFYARVNEDGCLRLMKINSGSLMLWYLPFWIWATMTRLWSSDAQIQHINISLTIFRICILLFTMDLFVTTQEKLFELIKGFCMGTSFFSLLMLFISPFSTYGTTEFGQKLSVHRNTIGYICFFASIFCIYLVNKCKDRRYWGLFTICLITALCSGSRKIIFAYGLSIVVLIAFQGDYKKTIKMFLMIVLVALITIPILYQIPFIKNTFGERLLAVVDDSIQDSSIMYRNYAKLMAIKLIQKFPLQGGGWSAVKMSYSINGVSIYAHNNYLEVAADFGLIGVVLFFRKNIYILISCIKKIKDNLSYRVILVLILGLMLLDYGQVSYIYISLISVWGIVYKLYEFTDRKDLI